MRSKFYLAHAKDCSPARKCFAKFAAIAGLLAGLFGAIEVRADPTGVQIIQQIQTVFVIALENHNLTQPGSVTSPQPLLGNPAAPYINSLITPGNSNAVYVSYATRYFNSGIGVHPSEPNYIWAEAGTDFGVHTSADPSTSSSNIFNAPHLTRQFNTAGITWKNYQEDVQLSTAPTISAAGTSTKVINPYYHTGDYNYAVRHNPMAFFSDTSNQNVLALTNLPRDLTNNTIARYNWITPNLYNDQHSPLPGNFLYHGTNYTGDQAGVAQGDNFLAILVPQIMASPAFQNNGVIIIRMDETEGGDTTNFTMPEIVISPLAKGNAYASSLEMNHSSDLKTMEELFGLNFLTNAIPANEPNASGSGYNNVATVNDLSDFFQPCPTIAVSLWPAGAKLTSGLSTANFGAAYNGSNLTNTFTVTNSGLMPLTLTNVTLSGTASSDFTLSGIALPSLVATNSSVTFNVIFSPTTTGTRPASLQIISNVPGATPFTVALTGLGLDSSTPYLAASTMFHPGGFQLNFDVPIGQHYRILRSPTLTEAMTNWTVITSGTANTNPLTYIDPSASTTGNQFYRIVVP